LICKGHKAIPAWTVVIHTVLGEKDIRNASKVGKGSAETFFVCVKGQISNVDFDAIGISGSSSVGGRGGVAGWGRGRRAGARA